MLYDTVLHTFGQIVPVILNLRNNDKGIFLSVAHVNCSQEVKSVPVPKAISWDGVSTWHLCVLSSFVSDNLSQISKDYIWQNNKIK